MNFWRSIAGMLEMELTSAEPEAALAAVNALGVEVFKLRQISDLTCSFRIHRRDYPKLAALCGKRGESLRLLKKNGLYWTGKGILTRPVLFAGLLLLVMIVLYLPTRVYFVRVEGNISVPSRLILAAAEESGICFGASRREVRSEKVKNALLSSVPELQWAGVNTSGCVAMISVRERTDTGQTEVQQEITSIVAGRDGFILSATATSGNLVVQPGQTVKAGQVLISGYTDCGICIQATQSKGEIVAQTNREINAVTPSECIRRDEIQDVRKKYSLLIRKKRINLWKDSGISDTSCGRMYEEYYLTLPGGFQLPIALCVDKYISYTMDTFGILHEDAEAELSDFAELYLQQQMIAGSIHNRQHSVVLEDGIYHLKGNYVCSEMIGRVQREQIGDTNGKNS